MPGGVSVQGVSGLLGCLFRRGQLRFSASAEGGKCWKCCLQQKARWRRGKGETRIEDRGSRIEEQRQAILDPRSSILGDRPLFLENWQAGRGSTQGNDRLCQRQKRHAENLDDASQRQGPEATHQGSESGCRSPFRAGRKAAHVYVAARRVSGN